jgi:CBS domain-containing protein
MAEKIADLMSRDPVTLSKDAPVLEAAQAMRESDIGDVIVLDDAQQLSGIVTDRDIAIRLVAEGRDPGTTKLQEICSTNVSAVSPNDSIGDAVRLMTDKAIRRAPVVEEGKVVGIVSIGDLAVTADPDSGLADISAAPPNK